MRKDRRAEEFSERSFSGFRVSLVRGSRAKKRLSNSLEIEIPGDRASVMARMTLREARALQSWLNEQLPQD